MKQNKLFLGLATIAAALTFASCSSDEPELNSQQPKQANTISFTSTVSKTRATSDGQATQLNVTYAKVGVFALTGETPATITNGDNNQYTVEGNGTLTKVTNDIVWPEEGDVTIYAYAPYDANWAGKYNQANTFTVKTDQSTEENYVASDLVYGVPTSNPVAKTEEQVSLGFTHKLAKVNITIAKDNESTLDLSSASVTITNTKTSTTFNPSTGAVGTADENSVADITVVSALGDATTACAIIVPQEVASGTALVKIVAGGKTFIAKLGANVNFQSGSSYNFTVNVGNVTADVTEVTLTLGSSGITAWGNQALDPISSVQTLYASFGNPGGNASYDKNTNTYSWWAGNNCLMPCFTFDAGTLSEYKTLHFKISSLNCSAGDLRFNFQGNNSLNEDKSFTYSNLTADTELTIDITTLGITLADVTKIQFGGGGSTGSASSESPWSLVIKTSDVYLTSN